MEDIKPKNLDDVRLQMFMDALESGADIPDSCLYARIKPDEYAAHSMANPGWADENKRAPIVSVVEGRISLRKGVKTNPDLALKYLERKKKDEFSLRNELTGKDGKDLKLISID